MRLPKGLRQVAVRLCQVAVAAVAVPVALGDEPQPSRPLNQIVAEQLAAAIAAESTAKHYHIEIQYVPGVATLRGTVANAADAEQILAIVRSKDGVEQVVNELTMSQLDNVQAAIFQKGTPAPAPMAPQAAPPTEGAQTLAPAAPQHTFMQRGAMQYDSPYMPPFAWPAYAPYPNYSAVQYPKCYGATDWPYIGPLHPYPEVPLDWRSVRLKWNDGYWFLRFYGHWQLKFFERY
jgi:hypothetical protein